MPLSILEKSKKAVDQMVEEGLDCPSMMHAKIEEILIKLLDQHEEEVREEEWERCRNNCGEE